MRGLSVDTVTGPFGDIDMEPIMQEIKQAARNSSNPNSRLVTKLRAPIEVAGETDMLIGLKYNNLFPEPIFTTPEGLTLFKSKFLPNSEGEVACIGGPSKALSQMVNHAGVSQIMSIFTTMTEHPETFSRNLEYFPKKPLDEFTAVQLNMFDCDTEALGYDEALQELVDIQGNDDSVGFNTDSIHDKKEKHLSEVLEEPNVIEYVECIGCNDVVLFSADTFSTLMNDVNKFLDLQDIGLKMEYRCPTCRNCINCKRGENYEKISIKQEEEQCRIRESIWIDTDRKRAVAKLPFRLDPDKYLTNNRGVAIKMLDRVCTK